MKPMFAFLLLITPVAHSFTLPKCEVGGLEKNASLVQKVSIFEIDKRKRIPEFAGSKANEPLVKKEFAATGRMFCYPEDKRKFPYAFTIQIIGKKNLVVTAGHGFFEPGCIPMRVEKCTAHFPMTGNNRPYKIKTDTWEIGGCTSAPNKNDRTDWAVFELEEEVDVTPYDLPPDDYRFPDPPNAPVPVLQVSAEAHNLPKLDYENAFTAYNFLYCEIKSRSRYSNIGLQSDCSLGKGTSGGAQLISLNNRHTMIAMVVSDDGEEKNGQPYDAELFFAGSVAVEGRFLEAIKKRLAPPKTASSP